nr:DUF2946 domain-containing protein [Erwinia piriflorinigrans]
MFSFSRLSQRRMPALIAIMAILMLFIAPDVSTILEQRRGAEHHHQTTAENPRSGLNEMAQHGMMNDMPMVGGHNHCNPTLSQTPDDGLHHQRSSGNMLEHFACGYCQLLVHLPLLLAIFIVIIRMLLLSTRTPAPLKFSPYHFTFFPGLSQPRAPPVN